MSSTGSASKVLRYPQRSIGRRDDYMIFTILKYNAPGIGFRNPGSFGLGTSEDVNRGTREGQTTSILGNIILPMPQGISDSMAAGWSADGYNPLEAVAVRGLSSIAQGDVAGGKDIINEAMAGIKGTLQDDAAVDGLTAGATKAAINAITGGEGGINQVLSRATGQILNNNVELLFNSVELRGSFQFQFDLIPRNSDEGEEIKQIIRTFKKSMLPTRKSGSTGSEVFVQSPSVFRVNYMQGASTHPFLNKFKVCALTGMTVDYSASGYASYEDSTPVHMRLNLSMQELSPIYSEDYDRADATGVGF